MEWYKVTRDGEVLGYTRAYGEKQAIDDVRARHPKDGQYKAVLEKPPWYHPPLGKQLLLFGS